MAIDPLQLIPTRLLPSAAAARGGDPRGSSFETLLSSLDKQADARNNGVKAAAELLRMEMMQNSLTLFGEDQEPQRPSGLQALETLAAQVACGGAGGLAFGAGAAAAVSSPGGGGTGHVGPRVHVGPSLPQKGTDAGPASGAGGSADAIEKTAAEFLGTPYRFGGEGPSGIDCSSFVQQVFREHRIALPRTAREQIKVGADVAPGDLRRGDLVFFHTYASYPSHVGIYLGDGKMIHASSVKGEVTVSDMNTDYFRSRFVGAKRIA